MFIMKVKNKKKITIQEIGLYIKIIKLDFNPESNEELATLISDTFNIECTQIDIENYENLYLQNIQIEDYELENRKQENDLIF